MKGCILLMVGEIREGREGKSLIKNEELGLNLKI